MYAYRRRGVRVRARSPSSPLPRSVRGLGLELHSDRVLELPAIVAGSLGVGASEVGLGDVQRRGGPVHVVECVERFETDLELHLLREAEVLGQ